MITYISFLHNLLFKIIIITNQINNIFFLKETEFSCKLRKGKTEKGILKGKTLKIVTYVSQIFFSSLK